jgi:hypothetical protein
MFKVLITSSTTANLLLYRLSTIEAARSIAVPKFGEIARIYDVDNRLVGAYSYMCPLALRIAA